MQLWKHKALRNSFHTGNQFRSHILISVRSKKKTAALHSSDWKKATEAAFSVHRLEDTSMYLALIFGDH